MRAFKSKEKGFSLIELVLTLAILGIVIQVVYSIFFVGISSFAVSNNKGFSQEGVRLGELFIAEELKNIESLGADSEGFGINYYTMSYNNDDKKIVRNYYDASNVLIDSKSVAGNWSEIVISNTSNGVVEVYVKQVEQLMNKTSEYDLDFVIEITNDNTLNSGEVWDLINGDIIYYTKSEDTSLSKLTISIDDELNQGDGYTQLSFDQVTVTSYKQNGTVDQVFYAPPFAVGISKKVEIKITYTNPGGEDVSLVGETANVSIDDSSNTIIMEFENVTTPKYVSITIEGSKDSTSLGNITKYIKLEK